MRNNLAILLAVVALGISVWNAAPRDPKPAEDKGADRTRHLTPLPQIDSQPPADCGAPGTVTSLKVLMRAQINPTMTRLSFALHHDQSDDRFKVVADNAARLLGCIHVAPNLPPAEIGIAGLPDYFRFLGSMQENTLGVQIAALEGDVDGARHWFGHLKQDCVACHSRFRVEATGEQP